MLNENFLNSLSKHNFLLNTLALRFLTAYTDQSPLYPVVNEVIRKDLIYQYKELIPVIIMISLGLQNHADTSRSKDTLERCINDPKLMLKDTTVEIKSADEVKREVNQSLETN